MGGLGGIDLGEDAEDFGDLSGGLVGRDIDDMEDEVGVGDLFEGGAEGLDEGSGEVADEADSIGKENSAAGGEGERADGGIEGGEHAGVGENSGGGDAIEESGFAGVGVTGQRNSGDGDSDAALAMQEAAGADIFEVSFEFLDTDGNAAAVGFELGFTGTAGADAAALAGEGDALTGEAGEDVFELGEFDLQATFGGAGATGEDIEDELGAVNDANADGPFEIALLGGGEIVINDDDVGLGGFGIFLKFLNLALAKKGGGVGEGADLEKLSDDFGTGGEGEFFEFAEGFSRAG